MALSITSLALCIALPGTTPFFDAASTASADASQMSEQMKWNRVRPGASFVSVALPGTTDDQSGVRETIVGDIEHETTSASPKEGLELSITATELPDTVNALTTEEMLLEKARDELLKANEGSKTQWKAISAKGKEARTLSYETRSGSKGRAELYMSDGVLVVLNAIYDPKNVDGVEKFFRSKRFK